MAAQTSSALLIHWALLFSAPWTVAANRVESNFEAAMPTGFASCTCEKQVLVDKELETKEVILVTKKWDLDQCVSTCPGYCGQDEAPFVRCLEVRTETGNTGDNKDEHFKMIANMVPVGTGGEPEFPMPGPMERKESYMPENAYLACSCKTKNTSHFFLYGHEHYMNGLKVWGRVGCQRSCSQECLSLGSISTGCIQAEMTYAKDQVGEVGYQRVPLVVSNAKRAFPEAKAVNKVQQQKTVTESDTKVQVPFDKMNLELS